MGLMAANLTESRRPLLSSATLARVEVENGEHGTVKLQSEKSLKHLCLKRQTRC